MTGGSPLYALAGGKRANASECLAIRCSFFWKQNPPSLIGGFVNYDDRKRSLERVSGIVILKNFYFVEFVLTKHAKKAESKDSAFFGKMYMNFKFIGCKSRQSTDNLMTNRHKYN